MKSDVLMQLNLNTSYKAHATVAFLMSLWLVLFLVLIAPFDVADLSFKMRLILMPFYGVISFVTYMLLTPLQNWIYQKTEQWNLLLEVGFTLAYNIAALVGCFMYYKSSHINGVYPLEQFTFEVYYPIFFLLFSILIILRWVLFKRTPSSSNQKILLKGENKLDALHIRFADLVSVSSADNYVEVSYLVGDVLHKKLLRNTLKNIASEQEGLLKTHRSHLINPAHFIGWKDSSTVQLTQMEAPVSNTYRQEILAIEKTRP